MGSDVIDKLVEKELISDTIVDLMNSIGNENVFSIQGHSKGIYLLEECDNYFAKSLTKDEVILISNLFKVIYENYDDLLHEEGE